MRWKPQIRPTTVKPVEACEHTWQTFKQTVRPDNPEYKGATVFLKVIACTKCKEKHYTDYIKEEA